MRPRNVLLNRCHGFSACRVLPGRLHSAFPLMHSVASCPQDAAARGGDAPAHIAPAIEKNPQEIRQLTVVVTDPPATDAPPADDAPAVSLLIDIPLAAIHWLFEADVAVHALHNFFQEFDPTNAEAAEWLGEFVRAP